MSTNNPLSPYISNQFEPDLIPIDQIQAAQALPDGSTLFNIRGEDELEDDESSSAAFHDNIASELSDDVLSGIAAKLLDEIKQDIESRSEWERSINLSYKYLGFRIEEFRQVPFLRACAAFDTSVSSALFHSYSTARAEMFPAAGPARSEIFGTPNQEVEDQGERVKMFMNWYLTVKDKQYYSDSERLLLYVIFFGCAFRKVYQDPILNRPIARLITPQDFIINNNTTSLQESDRLTQILYLNRKEILQRQSSGDFIKFDVPLISEDTYESQDSPIEKTIKKQEGIRTDSNENKSLFKFYEVHVNLDAKDVEKHRKGERLKNPEIPRPYIVTICVTSRKVVSIRRNWKEEDEHFNRIEYFVHYYYLPGFGLYSLGMAQLMGSNTIALTSILRQLIDAGTLSNFPGGIKMRGMRVENNDRSVGPSEFLEVDTGGLPLDQCVMLMPYKEPSGTLLELRKELKQETGTLISTVETEIPEMGTNMPVGTTLALLEVANKVQSTVLRSLHVSLGHELQLLFKLFGEYLEDEPYPFAVPGKDVTIVKADFSDRVSIVPVSDPNVLTSTHRLMRSQALLQLVQSNPEIHDVREAYHRMYTAMNVENIDKLLPPVPEPMPLDPQMENMLLLSGKEIAVRTFQDDDAHIIVHQSFTQNPMVMSNPAIFSGLSLHIQKHKCYRAFKKLYMERKQQEIQQQAMQYFQPQINAMMFQGMPYELAMDMVQPQMQSMVESMQQQISPPEVTPEMEQQMLLDPEIQNIVAKQDAEEAMQQAQAQQQAQAEQLDPNKVMIADIEQRREASHLKDGSDKLKAETEAFKAQLKFEAEQAKTDSQREIAQEKHEVDMLIAERKAKPTLEHQL